MNWIKDVTHNVLLLLSGILFLLIGISGDVVFIKDALKIDDFYVRVLVSILGVVLVGISIFLEYRKNNLLKTQNNGVTSKKNHKLEASEFFYTLDNSPSSNFSALVDGAKSVSILGRTAINLLSQYENLIVELCNSGCTVRVAVLDPQAGIHNHIYGSSPDIFAKNMSSTFLHIKDIKKKSSNRFHVKKSYHSPTFSMIKVEKEDSNENTIRVQLFFLHSKLGRDRPTFEVCRNDEWYNAFSDEFELIWEEAEPWNYKQDHFPD